jgi:hypothetical protein
LLGELAKTAQGCSFLLKKNVVATMIKEVFQSPEASMEQQAAMWALVCHTKAMGDWKWILMYFSFFFLLFIFHF